MSKISEYLNELDYRQLEVLKYSNDPVLFMTDILGLDCEDFHQEWLKAFENNKFMVLLAPRGHGKTTAVGSYITWRIARDRRVKILIVTINQAKANNMMTFVQECLTSNQKIIDLFGTFRGGMEWSRDSIRVKLHDTGIPSKEPTLEVIGRGSRIVSSHYDLIILDDVTDDDACRTEMRRRELEDWYRGPLVGTFMGHTKLINIGTRWHEDDFHSFLMRTSGYKVLTYKALLNQEEYDEGKEDAKVLWPKHLPWDDKMRKEINKDLECEGKPLLPEDALTLQFIRKHQGELFFQMQYQNNIISSGISKFKSHWIDSAIGKFNKLDGILPLGLKRYIGVDLGGEDETSDWGVSTVIGIDESGDIFILDSIRSHGTLNWQTDIMKSLDDKYHAARIGMDAAAQQKSITSAAMRDNPNMPILPIKSTRIEDKDTRIERLAVLFETNRVHLNPELKHLIDELRLYPRAKHDDCIDSVTFALEAAKTGGHIEWNRVADLITARRTYHVTKI